jgi:Mn-dependent DtxR family transcriptional regulator
MKEREGWKAEQIRNEAYAYSKINQNQKIVLSIIREYEPITNEEIAIKLGWYPNRVTPRVKELRELGIVEYCGYTTTKSGRKACLWRIKSASMQKINFKVK